MKRLVVATGVQTEVAAEGGQNLGDFGIAEIALVLVPVVNGDDGNAQNEALFFHLKRGNKIVLQDVQQMGVFEVHFNGKQALQP